MTRRKVEDIAGVVEFRGMTRDSPEIVRWLAEHRSRGGGTVRLSQGATGCRVALGTEADLAKWQERMRSAA